ncbi:hypothetical protein BJX66DRAFT_298970 [Aspergillus keveii]|uniref:Secreted protein n=1 Tax=Aspergillus keveii TaxID=714993 RepID=A0ABR4GD37_9EURO
MLRPSPLLFFLLDCRPISLLGCHPCLRDWHLVLVYPLMGCRFLFLSPAGLPRISQRPALMMLPLPLLFKLLLRTQLVAVQRPFWEHLSVSTHANWCPSMNR